MVDVRSRATVIATKVVFVLASPSYGPRQMGDPRQRAISIQIPTSYSPFRRSKLYRGCVALSANNIPKEEHGFRMKRLGQVYYSRDAAYMLGSTRYVSK